MRRSALTRGLVARQLGLRARSQNSRHTPPAGAGPSAPARPAPSEARCPHSNPIDHQRGLDRPAAGPDSARRPTPRGYSGRTKSPPPARHSCVRPANKTRAPPRRSALDGNAAPTIRSSRGCSIKPARARRPRSLRPRPPPVKRTSTMSPAVDTHPETWPPCLVLHAEFRPPLVELGDARPGSRRLQRETRHARQRARSDLPRVLTTGASSPRVALRWRPGHRSGALPSFVEHRRATPRLRPGARRTLLPTWTAHLEASLRLSPGRVRPRSHGLAPFPVSCLGDSLT